MSDAPLDEIAGWITAYKSGMTEKREWEAKKKEWEKKWGAFMDAFKDDIFTRLDREGADTGTVDGEPVIKVKEMKRKGYEVKPTVVRSIKVVEPEEAKPDMEDLDKEG